MKKLVDYIKENLDLENFEYKFEVWFKDDKSHLEPMIDLIRSCRDRKIVQKDDVEGFLKKNTNFKVKKFVDFFDEDVKRDENISLDYVYIFSKIIENFVTNFNLAHKVDYLYQALHNGEANVEVWPAPMSDIKKEEEK